MSRRPNDQLGITFGPPRRTDVWRAGDGGVAPHHYTPEIPVLDTAKLPKVFQGNNLRKMDNGDWIMWPTGARKPRIEGTGSKAKWKYEIPAKGKKKAQVKTAIGGGKVGAKGKKGWLRGGLNDDQLQAIQFAASLKGTAKQRALGLVQQNALYVVSHSAGKDSQAMFLYLHRELDIPAEQTATIHADLPGADWPSVALPSGRHTPTLVEHMEATMFGMPLQVVVARWGTGGRTPAKHRGKIKTFESYVRHRHEQRPTDPSFPSARNRWCTGDLKTSPIQKAVREELCVRNNLRSPGQKDSATCKVQGKPWRIVVDCEGLRAGESSDRAARDPWELDLDQCLNGRIWFTWLPIFDWTAKTDRKYQSSKRDVTDYILAQGQAPFWTYGTTPEHMAMIQERAPGAEHGVSRLSCQFCIFSSPKDQAITAQLDPAAYDQMCALEKDVGSSLSLDTRPLPQRTGVVPASALKRKVNPCALGLACGDEHHPEFTVHDLQLSEILVKGPHGRRRNRAGGKKKGRRRNGAAPISTQFPGVTLIPRALENTIESYDVLVEGRRVGALDYVRAGKTRRWTARTSSARAGSDRIAVHIEEDRDAALERIIGSPKKRKSRREASQRRRNEPLRVTLAAHNPALEDLKRKLMAG